MIRAKERLAITIALIASIGLHLALYLQLAAFDFDLVDFELALPSEIEFGVTEAMEAASAPVVPAPAEAPAQTSGSRGRDGEGERGDEGEDEHDAPDAGLAEPAEDTPDAGVAEGPLVAEAPSSVDGPVSLPPGAQLAMRVDMQRIGRSPLAPAVREFFRQVPDWYLLTHGSGIDPLTDLDRVYLATPDPRRRSELVIAGRVVGGEAEIRGAVDAMASARGEPVAWRRARRVPVADWRNLDETARVLALLGPRQFAIAREDDLPILTAMIRHREALAETEGLERTTGADALLSMGPNDALMLEVEGIHRYVRGRVEHVPARARIAVGEASADRIAVEGLAFFDSPEAAAAAQPYWDAMRQQVARHPLIRFSGMSSVLEDATLVPEGDRIRVRTQLSHTQARAVLSYIGARIAAITGFVPPADPSATPPSPPGEPAAPAPEAPVAPEGAPPSP